VMDRGIPDLLCAAQHAALYTHAEPALFAQPGACLGRRLRARNQPHFAGATWQDKNDAIAVAEDWFDDMPIDKQSQVGIRCGRALRHWSTDRGSPVRQALPHWLH